MSTRAAGMLSSAFTIAIGTAGYGTPARSSVKPSLPPVQPTR